MILGMFMFLSGLLSLVFVRKHYLLSLLSIEFLVLSIYFFCMIYFSYYVFEFYFSVIFLVFGVCEGVLGLSLIVFLSRKGSSDYVSSLILC